MTQHAEIADGPGLLDGFTAIASRAMAAILAVRVPEATRRDKADRSPVTAADEAAEAEILGGLAKLLPGVPVVSEEAATRVAPEAQRGTFLLVDPLDGTREFLAGEAEYTVNIALVSGGVPVIGVIAAPALGQVWRGIAGRGAERLQLAPGALPAAAQASEPIRTRKRPARGAVAVISRFHRDPATDAYLERIPDVQTMTVGSSIKFCRIAEGSADIYARLVSISEWDVAAGHALVTAAGGTMTMLDGGPLPYGRAGFKVPSFLVSGDPTADRL